VNRSVIMVSTKCLRGQKKNVAWIKRAPVVEARGMAVHAAVRGVADASADSEESDTDSDVLFGVVRGGGGGSETFGRSGEAVDGNGFHARDARVSPWRGACVIRVPRDSDDSSDDDLLGEHDSRFGSPELPKDPGQVTPNANPLSPMGAGGLRAVSRARAVSHQRVASRRAAARAAADRRKEALELELHWALQAEAEERAAVAASAFDIAAQWAAAESAESAEAEREEREALDAMDARWKRDAAAVEAVLRADAAAAETAAKAKAEAEAAANAAHLAAARAHAEAESAEKRRLEAAAAAAASAAGAAAAAEAKAKADAQAASAAADQARRTGVGAGAGSSSGRPAGAVPKIQTSAEASAAEGHFASALRDARAVVAEYASSPVAKKERRLLNNQITVHVTQIAATKKQIEQKATDICQFLHQVKYDPQRTFCVLSLCKRVLTQCDSQVSKLNRFAFALAEVSVRVSVFAPAFGQLLIALLHESCVLAVPKYYPFVEGRYVSDQEYFKLMGYVDAEDQSGINHGEPPKLENTDSTCLRLRGFMLFYAAYTQVENAKHAHGLAHAWSWVSRLLNKIPPNRFSATALEAFLKHAGFAMNAAYGKQFHKLLRLVQSDFIPKLVEKGTSPGIPNHTRQPLTSQSRLFAHTVRWNTDLVRNATRKKTTPTYGRW
jgi:nucleoporin GLE1